MSKKLLEWDTCNLPEDYDDDDHYFAWQDFLSALTETLKELSSHPHWFVLGENLTWDHKSGYKIVSAATGEEFMDQMFSKSYDYIVIRSEGEHGMRWIVPTHDCVMYFSCQPLEFWLCPECEMDYFMGSEANERKSIEETGRCLWCNKVLEEEMCIE
jgi:hypothetical protein